MLPEGSFTHNIGAVTSTNGRNVMKDIDEFMSALPDEEQEMIFLRYVILRTPDEKRGRYIELLGEMETAEKKEYVRMLGEVVATLSPEEKEKMTAYVGGHWLEREQR